MLQDFFKDCVLLDKITENVNGFVVTEFVDGAEIRCGIARNSTTEAQIAEKNGMKSIFNIVFDESVQLNLNDRIKEKATGKIYRVTSDSREMTVPAVSDLHFSCVNAEVIQ